MQSRNHSAQHRPQTVFHSLSFLPSFSVSVDGNEVCSADESLITMTILSRVMGPGRGDELLRSDQTPISAISAARFPVLCLTTEGGGALPKQNPCKPPIQLVFFSQRCCIN